MKSRPSKVTVYQVRFYDIQTDEFRLSRRMATIRGAERMGGEILVDTAVEIDSADLETDAEWTPRDYNPLRSTGFQTQVR